MAWSAAPALGGRFAAARGVAAAMYPTRRRPGATYRGFAKALARRSAALLAAVAGHLRRTLEREARAAGQWLTHDGRAVLGVDATRLDCPRTAANEAAIGAAGRRGSGPQLLLTMLFHVASNVPWAFARGDARAGERAHPLGLLDALPARALLLADAGFVGYDFFAAVLASDRQFLVRVGANVRLLRDLDGGRAERRGADLVWLWPAGARRQDRPPLALRLVTLVDGRNRRAHLLTSALDAGELTDGRAGELYALRWSVEVKFRALKQTLGRRKLLAAAPATARAEADWSAVGLWMLELMCWRRSRARARGVAAALRAVRGAMAAAGPARRRGRRLADLLADAVPDAYRRPGPKEARAWPHKKRDRPPGEPRARTASPEEVAHAARLAAAERAA